MHWMAIWFSASTKGSVWIQSLFLYVCFRRKKKCCLWIYTDTGCFLGDVQWSPVCKINSTTWVTTKGDASLQNTHTHKVTWPDTMFQTMVSGASHVIVTYLLSVGFIKHQGLQNSNWGTSWLNLIAFAFAFAVTGLLDLKPARFIRTYKYRQVMFCTDFILVLKNPIINPHRNKLQN